MLEGEASSVQFCVSGTEVVEKNALLFWISGQSKRFVGIIAVIQRIDKA